MQTNSAHWICLHGVLDKVGSVVQSIYAKKWPNPKQIATVMKHIPKVVKFYVV